MIEDDLLERAAAVVRERYDGSTAVSARTEALIAQRVRPRAARRRWLPLGAIPLVACLAASAAWGNASGKLIAAVHSLVGVFALGGPPAPTTAVSVARRTPQPDAPTRRSAPEPAPRLTAAPEAPPSSPSPPSLPPARVLAVARPHQSAPLAASASASASPSPSAQPDSVPDTLFRAAHRAQFVGRDPARAIDLWDRYLSAAPNGSLAPEARYNRAIDLTQLGRKAEAAAALQPFARGDYGTYRQAEAQHLLEALAR